MDAQAKTEKVVLQIHDVTMAVQGSFNPRPVPPVVLQIQNSIVQQGVNDNGKVGK
jgi:hypothetical protein